MSRETLGLDPRTLDYLRSVSLREPDVARRLREETGERDDAQMQIAPEQGQLMALLAKLIGAERYLEIGTFTGYSAMIVAMALPEEAGVGAKIDLRIGPAVETLDAMLEKGRAGTFDYAFVDADKTGYPDYWERCLRLVRPGGLIAVDNVLRHGTVADPSDTDEVTEAVRAFNRTVHGDRRVDVAMVPIADGVTLARVR